MSVASQTHCDIEHIIVDGASADHTVVLVKLHGNHISTLISEPDTGIYDAMNKGIAVATGDWIGFLNADDILADSTCVAAIADTASRTNADAIYGDLVYVQEANTQSIVRVWKSGEFWPARLRFGWMPPHPTLYVRRQLIQELRGFNTRLKIAADYDFVLRCMSRDGVRVAYIPKVLVRMRMGGASNHSIKAMVRKSGEDLAALRRSGVGGIFTLLCKNVRKLPQFFVKRIKR